MSDSNTVVRFYLNGDPQEYRLRFDYNQFCAVEEMTGLNLLSAFSGRGITASQTRAILFAYLRAEHPKVTLAEAGGLLTKDMQTVLRKIGELSVAAGLIEDEGQAAIDALSAKVAGVGADTGAGDQPETEVAE